MLCGQSRVWNFKHCWSPQPKKLELPRDQVQKETGSFADRAGSNSMHNVRDLFPILNQTEKSKSLRLKEYNDISYFDTINCSFMTPTNTSLIYTITTLYHSYSSRRHLGHPYGALH